MILTPAWTPVRERDKIGPLGVRWHYRNDRVRFKIAAAGRRSTKTLHAKRMIVAALTDHLDIPEEERPPWWKDTWRYFYGAPTQDQANDIAFDDLVKLTPPEWVSRIYRGKKPVIKTVVNSELHVIGLDEARRVEGQPWNGMVLDEFADMKADVWQHNIVPTLADRNAWAIILGVPDYAKPNNAQFKKLFERGLSGDPEYRSYTWKSNEVLSDEQMELMREEMSPLIYRQETEASWESAPGRAYAEFTYAAHVTPEAVYMPGKPIFVSCDFNRNNHNWGLYQWTGEKYRAFDEIYFERATVEVMCVALKERLDKYKGVEVWFFGDHSGDTEKAEATDSAWGQIRTAMKDRVPRPVWRYQPQGAISDRVDLVNAWLRNAKDQVRTEINPKCLNLIRDMEEVTTALLYSNRKTALLSHASDNFGYMLTQHGMATRSSNVAAKIRQAY